MKKFLKITCLVLLIAELLLLEKLRIETPMTTVSRLKTTAEETTQAYNPGQTNPNLVTYTQSPSTPAPVNTPAPTPEPTPEPPKEYVISFVGDCTLWSNQNYQAHPAGFAGVMGDNYAQHDL